MAASSPAPTRRTTAKKSPGAKRPAKPKAGSAVEPAESPAAKRRRLRSEAKALESASTTAVEALEAEANGEVDEEDEDALVLEVREEFFALRSEVPAIVMLKLSAAADPRTPVPKQMSAVASFLEHVVKAKDRDRFMDLLENAEPLIDFEEINEILTDASEIIGGGTPT